jgi:uncharacterized SAM-dependent methyltransferase
MNVEILLTEAEIAEEFTEALEARDLPEKFLYWFPLSVKTWRILAASPAFSGLRSSWETLSENTQDLVSHFDKEVPVVSFGAGDGSKDRLLLREIRAAGKTVKYFPVDASQTLLEVACAAAEDDDFDVTGIKGDISSRMHLLLAADAAEAPRLFLLAGNTLGGFDPLDQIRNISDGMRPGDRLVIDAELDSPEALEAASSDVARAFAFAPLASVGVLPEDGRIKFERKEDSRRAGMSMVTKHFQSDRDLRIPLAASEINMARGERIFMNFRYLFSPEAFRWLLESQGRLKVDQLIKSTDNRFATAVCSKHLQ